VPPHSPKTSLRGYESADEEVCRASEFSPHDPSTPPRCVRADRKGTGRAYVAARKTACSPHSRAPFGPECRLKAVGTAAGQTGTRGQLSRRRRWFATGSLAQQTVTGLGGPGGQGHAGVATGDPRVRPPPRITSAEPTRGSFIGDLRARCRPGARAPAIRSLSVLSGY